MGRADAFEIGDGELALIDAALAEDDVAGLEPELGRLDIGDVAPSPYPQRISIQVLQATYRSTPDSAGLSTRSLICSAI